MHDNKIQRALLTLGISIGVLPLTGCITEVSNENYCSNANGDDFCVGRHGEVRSYCLYGGDSCREAHAGQRFADPAFDGCMEEEPVSECYSPCGYRQIESQDQSCVPDEATGTLGGMTTSGTGSSGGIGTGDASTSDTGDNTSDGMESSTTMPPLPNCGDGVVGPGEACDDGEETIHCDSDCTWRMCGDGHHNTASSEQCDDAGQSPICNTDCTWSICGDGTVNEMANEDCDDEGESETCDEDCTWSMCGDTHVNETANEECDSGGTDSPSCNSNCTNSECGDNYINTAAGEVCDDSNIGANSCFSEGYESGSLGCESDCLQFDTGDCDPFKGNCCNPTNTSVGCNNPLCASAVCSVNISCCMIEWGGICTAEALNHPECGCM